VDRKIKLALPSPVADARCRLDEWRRSRARRGPLPAQFWDEAGQLAQVYGINAIARALGLDYYSLKKHRDAAQKRPEATGPAFVEVSVARPSPTAAYVVELERPDGGRMKIQLAHQQDLIAVTESFWRCRA
jgi:hypothetical protein